MRVSWADFCPQQTELKQGIKVVIDGSKLHRAFDDAEIPGIEGEIEIVFTGILNITTFGAQLTNDGLVELLLRKRTVFDLLRFLLWVDASDFSFDRENLGGLGHRGAGAECCANTDDDEES